MTLPNQQKRAVLIVEDDEATTELERRALVKSGLSVRAVTQAEDAIALLRSESFVAVLLDYNLPGDDPWRVQEAAQSLVPRVPVIMVTALGNELVAAEAIHRGVDGYIKKTGDFWDQLPNIVSRAARLAEAEYAISRLASIVEASDDAIVGISLDGVVASWNSGAKAMFGYSAEEIIGRPISILTPPDRSAEIENILEKLQGGEHLKHFETVRMKKDGTPIHVSLTVSPVKDDTGKIASISEIARDITERKRFEQSLQEANRMKSEFLANMSHELRTPLNGILGFAEFLVDGKPGKLNAKQMEYLGDILNSGRHLLQVINDVLDLAKVEAGKMELNLETFPLGKAIEEVRAVVKPMAQKKHIGVAVDIAAEVDCVTLDQQKFKQVLYNLLSNSIKFTDDGGSVEIRASLRDSLHFKLAVTDNGIGIPSEDINRLFREFEQLESGASRRYQGTGLGLALTRKLVELQGGTITVESEVKKGSTFSVILPLVTEGTRP
jgi:PAS domain S-box-containing protein